jgi:hypothetical protein
MELGLNLPPAAAHLERPKRGRGSRLKSPLAGDEAWLQNGIAAATKQTRPNILHGHTPLPPPLQPAAPVEERGRGAAEFNVTGTSFFSKNCRERIREGEKTGVAARDYLVRALGASKMFFRRPPHYLCEPPCAKCPTAIAKGETTHPM